MQQQFDNKINLYYIKLDSLIFYGSTPASTVDTMNKCIELFKLDKIKPNKNNQQTVNN